MYVFLIKVYCISQDTASYSTWQSIRLRPAIITMAVPYSESDQGETTSVASDEVFISSSVYHEACSLYGHKCTHCRQNCEILLVPLIRAGSGVGEVSIEYTGCLNTLIKLRSLPSFKNLVLSRCKAQTHSRTFLSSVVSVMNI